MAAIQGEPEKRVRYRISCPEKEYNGPLPPGLLKYGPPEPQESFEGLSDEEICLKLGMKKSDLEKKRTDGPMSPWLVEVLKLTFVPPQPEESYEDTNDDEESPTK
ncbi:hypothetical protein MtrunA17_Chr5g0448341 [Medicago truncatula]|uniref:Uncharacterized protein n=1 Tax=Medicago truncatula TaxID=3880 RepID=G7K0P7_MEDTR|nr:hypothetical protein MTR_5g098690 [Medicago truncatula]RHN58181.1 hypothetical protein MtrunA17_Chr5g0448341 [Medicago truncatula]